MRIRIRRMTTKYPCYNGTIKMNALFAPFRKRPFIDKNGRIFGRFDIFAPLFFIILLILGIFVVRVVFQKDTYITAELYATGGEWWWNNPAPPYWLTDPIVKGAKEYDAQGHVLVDVLDVQKFESGERKMLWMKVKLRVSPMKGSRQYRFRLDPVQIGSLIYIAPNNIRVSSTVMWIDGAGLTRTWSDKTVTLEEYNIFPWIADAINVGDTMKADDGTVMAEVLSKDVRVSHAGIVEWDSPSGFSGKQSNRLNAIPNTDRRDVTLTLRLRTSALGGRDYFSYLQPLKIGFYLWVPLTNVTFGGNIIGIK